MGAQTFLKSAFLALSLIIFFLDRLSVLLIIQFQMP